MKAFVTGVNGQLGHDIIKELKKRGYEAVGSDITPAYAGADDIECPYVQMDITREDEVERVISGIDAVYHCAAWTAVDAAEEEENREKVFAVNAKGTGNIARACAKLDIPMTYLSTDYVFNGKGKEPWRADDKSYAPLNVYGESKLAGELAVADNLSKFFIVRIAWVFGKNGKNFVKTMLSLGERLDEIKVVNDQIGTPTYTLDLARLLVDMNDTDRYGYYHATNEGEYISWYDFSCEIMKQAGLKCRVEPVTTSEYGLSKAARPFNSRLDRSKLGDNGFEPLPEWKDALSRYLEEIGHGTD